MALENVFVMTSCNLLSVYFSIKENCIYSKIGNAKLFLSLAKTGKNWIPPHRNRVEHHFSDSGTIVAKCLLTAEPETLAGAPLKGQRKTRVRDKRVKEGDE